MEVAYQANYIQYIEDFGFIWHLHKYLYRKSLNKILIEVPVCGGVHKVAIEITS